MKTTVIQLDFYDDLASILDKMTRAGSGRVLLVWPRRNRLNLSEVDLVALSRKAEEMAARLAIVCQNPKMIEIATAHGISNYASVPVAERAHWVAQHKLSDQAKFDKAVDIRVPLLPRTRKKSANEGKTLRIITGVVSLMAVLALVIFLLPAATVTLVPQRQEKALQFDVWASTKVTAVNVNGNIPLYLHSVTLAGTKTIKSSGHAGIPNAFATALVEFTNLSGQELLLPAGTVVSTADETPIRFETEGEVTLPAGTQKPMEVQVKALTAGNTGNVAAGQIQVVEGSLGGLVEVTNPEPASGGADSQAASPSEADYEILKNELVTELTQKAVNAFKEDPDFQLIPGSVKVKSILAETRSIEPGQPGEDATLSLDVEMSGAGYSQADMDLLSSEVLRAGLADDEQIFINTVTSVNKDGFSGDGAGGYRWSQMATTQVGQKVDAEKVRQMISGKGYTRAVKMLEGTYSLGTPPTFRRFFSPFFLPLAEFRIQVEVQ